MSVPTLYEMENMAEIRRGIPYFAEKIRESHHFKTLRSTMQVLVYTNGIYKTGGERIIEEECEKIIPGCSISKCKEVIGTIRRQTYLPEDEEFDHYEKYVNLKNGILNLTTGKLEKHSPRHLFRIQLPITYDPNAECKNFKEFLEECLPNPKNQTNAIEAFASVLLPYLKLEKMYMNVGSGSNGKSTYLDVIEQFLGKENVSNIAIHDLVNNRFAKAGLECKLANIYADISRRDISELGPVKAIISGDSIEVERKNQHPFKMRNTAKLFYSCNELPEIGEDSHAVYRRMVLIEWNQKFTHDDEKHQINSNLLEKLTTPNELSGILNLLIEHAQKIMKNGKLTMDDGTSQLRKKWAEKSDPIGTFLDSCVEQDFETNTPKISIFQAFQAWCRAHQITPKKERALNSKISQKFAIQDSILRIEGKSTRVWEGIRLKTM